MTDHLASLPVQHVAGWYRRLARSMSQVRVSGSNALAPIFLNHWLENRDARSTFNFLPPDHLKNSSYVFAVLNHHRNVFLSQEPTAGGLVRGAIVRLRSGVWNGSGSALSMSYHSLVSVGDTLYDLVRIQRSGSAGERDLLTALRGFQLHSDVTVQGSRLAENPLRVEAKIASWSTYVSDRYDWDYSEFFTVPNPDFGSRESHAVQPQERTLKVYHRNAKRLEDANLAAPYNIRSYPWTVTGPLFQGATEVLEVQQSAQTGNFYPKDPKDPKETKAVAQ